MAGDNVFNSILDEIHARAQKIQQRITDEAQIMIPGIKEEIFAEFGEYQQKKVEELFRSAVDSFYAAYSPEFYGRSYSLYDALDYQPDEYGIIDDQIDNDSLFSAEGVTPFERGGGSQGLFELVFMEGWHGGAAGTDRRGEERSVPSYRTPYDRYFRWGRQAFRSESPHDIAMRKIRGASGMMDHEFETIAARYAEILTDRLSRRAQIIASEVFSDWG